MDNECIHHWDIKTPDGSTWLLGTCRKCGEEKKFRATPPSKQITKRAAKKEKEEDKSLEKLAEEEAGQGDEW